VRRRQPAAACVLRYDPGPDAKAGQHRIEVRLKGVKGDVRARQGYWRAAR